MQLPYYMALHNAIWRYVKPCNKAIAFHISMTAPKYAINPLIIHFKPIRTATGKIVVLP